MKPKYHFFANARYALEGIWVMLKNERAFQLELAIVLPALVVDCFLPIDLVLHLLLAAVLFIILIAEAFNSAIEACVDLITEESHPMAKIAKDCASAGVFFSITLALLVWAVVLFGLFFDMT